MNFYHRLFLSRIPRNSLIVFALIFFLFPKKVLSQEIAITLRGDTVELFSNGKWKKYTYSQETQRNRVKITSDETDPFEGTRKIVTELWMNFGKSTSGLLLGNVIKIDSLIGFNIGLTSELGCLKEGISMVKVQLENDEIIELTQVSADNCAAVPSALFLAVSKDLIDSKDFRMNQQVNLDKLKEYAWVSLRVEGSQHNVIFHPVTSSTFEGEYFFQDHLTALERSSK